MVTRPRERPVRQRLGEDNRRARGSGYALDDGMKLLHLLPLIGEGVVALMRAGHRSEPAVHRPHVVQVVGDDGQAVPHPPFLEPGVLQGPDGKGAPVQLRSDGAFSRADHVEVHVVEPVLVIAHGRVEVGRDARVVDEFQQRAAPVYRVEEPVCRHVGLTLRLDMAVDFVVQPPKLIGVERVRHGDVALQVVEVFFVLVHGVCGKWMCG